MPLTLNYPAKKLIKLSITVALILSNLGLFYNIIYFGKSGRKNTEEFELF